MAAQLGYIASPAWLAAVEAGTAAPTEPVGTGPFVFESYSPGGSFVATKNPDYWRTDADGRRLPYLDRVELKVLEDIQSRSAALQTGDIDIMHTANTDEIVSYRGNDSFEMIESDEHGETSYILLNTSHPPLDDVRVRRALAMAINLEEYGQARGQGVNLPANGPYTPGDPGHLDDSGYPAFDPEGAKALVEEYEAEVGPVEFSFNTTTDDYNRISNELIAQYWEAVGVTVNINQVEQGSYINNAALGTFDAFSWRNHGGGYNPDGQYIWWSKDTALPEGQIALNFGRFQDDVIQGALDTIRTSPDEAERTAAAETINRRFGEQAYNLWLSWTVWAVMFRPEVHGLRSFTLPDGSAPLAPQQAGAFQIASLWVDEG
jgi:peptide/nickel transport system substrate-binding protein